MGRKKLERPSVDSLFLTVSKMLVPDYILTDFDIYGAKESTGCWTIELRERNTEYTSKETCKDGIIK
ncbi:hypothetical protein FACS1894199_16760 [Bacteroidia bacterium]|nr:hypothetical protein FACS1894199_16760 [Bacteroidia bacterium]